VEIIDHVDILESFLIISDEDIGDLTFGRNSEGVLSGESFVYCRRLSAKTCSVICGEKMHKHNLDGPLDYYIQGYRSIPNLIRPPTRLAHISRATFHPTIQFDAEKILRWWCDCPTRNRFVRCCSHGSSTIWFLSYARWDIKQEFMSSDAFMYLVTDSGHYSDFLDSSEDENDENPLHSLQSIKKEQHNLAGSLMEYRINTQLY
jgi:hypothetical protein